MTLQPKHTEARFEDAIELSLLARGYTKGNPVLFDAGRGFFPADVISYVKASQPKKWDSLVGLQGSNAEATLLDSLVKELASRGVLSVLRHGFKCFGKTYLTAAFQPATQMNPEAEAAYEQNILTITRQVAFNPGGAQTIDVVLSINGLPVVTIELKNPMSGQNVEHAKRQYENDRDPRLPLFQFNERALVHFAADPDLVFMATKLDNKTTYWLPFNKGNKNGAGNPPGVSGSYRTGYLWDDVLSRDSLMDLIARFIHLETKERKIRGSSGIKTIKKEDIIFPRYHQLTAVRKLVRHAKGAGTGHNSMSNPRPSLKTKPLLSVKDRS
jgi:type I restriction enzyme R subunit